MPRYVILEHDHPTLHWDLMLEAGPVLRTWRLYSAPRVGAPAIAESSFDHRPFYLDYEGPVSGGRGAVKRWDSGTFEFDNQTSAEIVIRLNGLQCQGIARLLRTDDGSWQLTLTGEVGSSNRGDSGQ